MKTVAIIQARMASTRLPGKVLADIQGKPMIRHVVERARRARTIDEVIVATSHDPSNDALVSFCEANAISCFRGDESDVLDRYYQAAASARADIVVRLTADCPLLSPRVIDRVVSAFAESGCDYVTNTLRYTYPDGLDVEVFSFAALQRAWAEARKPSEREHVTPYLRASGRFRTANVEHDPDLSSGRHRWTVDDREDLEFVRRIYEELADRLEFEMEDVLELLERKPELRAHEGRAVMNEGYYRTLYAQAAAGAAPQRPLAQSQAWLERSRKIIPGASQTFSKSTSQYVQGVSPVFLERGAGCRVWDVDGNEYIDYVQGLLPNILGYAHPEVNAAVAAQLAEGHSFSLPHPKEVLLAEKLKAIIPCAEMVRFCKNGSDATAGAIRAARAWTKRDRVATCGYHGWQDWYIGGTTRHAGVPQAVRELTHAFRYNDLESLAQLLDEHPGEFAAVIMEPITFIEPQPGYLAAVKELAGKHGALLIFDEIVSGFHFGLGGAQKLFGVKPDLACFGKAMGNGFPIGCVVGRADVMAIFNEIFFSFTFGGEVASIAASLAVLEILETTDVLARIRATGQRLKDGFNTLANEAGLHPRFECIGLPSWTLLKFRDAAGADSFLERSLFQQEVTKRGLLILVTHNLSGAHDAGAVEETLQIYASALKTLAGWLAEPDPSRFLEGPMIEPVFRVR